jgi:hypothetical protein
VRDSVRYLFRTSGMPRPIAEKIGLRCWSGGLFSGVIEEQGSGSKMICVIVDRDLSAGVISGAHGEMFVPQRIRMPAGSQWLCSCGATCDRACPGIACCQAARWCVVLCNPSVVKEDRSVNEDRSVSLGWPCCRRRAC